MCYYSLSLQHNLLYVFLPQYTGTWYQIERYPYPEVSNDSTCIGTRYTLVQSSGIVNVLNWEVQDGVLSTIEGEATVNAASARLEVVLPVPGSDDGKDLLFDYFNKQQEPIHHEKT